MLELNIDILVPESELQPIMAARVHVNYQQKRTSQDYFDLNLEFKIKGKFFSDVRMNICCYSFNNKKNPHFLFKTQISNKSSGSRKRKILEARWVVVHRDDVSNLLGLLENHIKFSTSKYITKRKIVFDRNRTAGS